MKRNWKRKIMKIIGITILFLGLLFSFGIYQFSKRKSDEKIIKILEKDDAQVFIRHLTYNNKDIRILEMQKTLDTVLPVLVFVHGSPGSALDFKKYLVDKALNKKYNILAYDRIGYGDVATGEVLNSLREQVEALHEVIREIPSEDIVLVAYSYGGTIAMASDKPYKKKIILAGAVKGDLEPAFWALNLYEWPLTRPLMPKVFQGASQEKLQHISELMQFEDQWNVSEAAVLSIHGKKDRIVPFENALFLEDKMDENKFSLLSLEEGNHALVWTEFELIKNEILKVTNE